MRVLIAPVEIAGYATGLQKGLRGLGVQADVLDLSGNPYAYPLDPPRGPVLGVLAAVTASRRAASGAARWALVASEVVIRVLAAVVAPMRYDAIVYLYGATLAGPLDPLVARLLRRPTVLVYLGSDSRPPYLDGQFADPEGGTSTRSLARRARRTAARVRRAERRVSYVVDHPCSGHFHDRPFLDFLAVGLPTVAESVDTAADHGPAVRIVHAPTAPRWKGSARIRAAVEEVGARVRGNGLRVEYVELCGVPSGEVHRAIASADLVVDQLYSDTLLAGIGTEAAVIGVPALAFGYAYAQLAGRVRGSGLSMRHYADPEQLVPVLHRFVVDAHLRAEVGAELRDFVRTRWSPDAVARRYLALFSGEAEPAWWVRPEDVTYDGGWGMSRETSGAVLQRLVAEEGEGSLAVHGPARAPLLRRAAAAGPAKRPH